MRPVVAAFLLLVGCAEGGPRSDASAIAACVEYDRVLKGTRAGVLTPSEMRDGLKRAYEYARVSETPAVKNGAAAVLRAVTSDAADVPRAMREFLAACNAL